MCGFEAFINGKHVIGKVAFPRLHFCFCFLQYSILYFLFVSSLYFSFFQVKEKEQARKEYRLAIEKGHGAYLMDQDAPVRFSPCCIAIYVFTIYYLSAHLILSESGSSMC